ncbi:uncharacterized protein LOC117144496 [Drosophila mauritiana]|uniref:Uncharacterized protein LOC117144496 n=1 Tax=Drosophila mauritiana TaxID=7226 RepID=A0A6P8KNP1_DROMA|nr:uncharacterized protein LOC117144496 [Drosophila mauritiana]
MSGTSTSERSNSEDSPSNPCLTEVLRNCANIQSLESLNYEYNDVLLTESNEGKMITPNPYSFSGNISISSGPSEDVSFTESILEDNGCISLAYENLKTIPRRLADKFAAQTKFLDLSHNDFRNLRFLSFFEDLDTLILDRNVNLDINTFPYLPSLRILWINNCDIANITDWIHRIERQCPALDQLSCMGNPGIRTVFGGQGPREYILQVLPQLKYLDGLPTSRSEVHATLSSSQGQGPDSTSNSEKPPPASALTFKDIFRPKHSRKSHSGRMYGNGSSTN